MAYNSRRQGPNNPYVRFNSYNGADKNGPYGNMSQQPDLSRQGLSSAPQLDMVDAPPQLGDNRFANLPPPSMNEQQPQQQIPTRVIEFKSPELNELLSNPKYHYTKEGKPTKVCVKVYTDWCGPCRGLAPKFDQLSTEPEHQDILFVSIDGEKLTQEIGHHISVSAVPVIFTFHCGRKLNMIPGADIGRIREAVQELLCYGN